MAMWCDSVHIRRAPANEKRDTHTHTKTDIVAWRTNTGARCSHYTSMHYYYLPAFESREMVAWTAADRRCKHWKLCFNGFHFCHSFVHSFVRVLFFFFAPSFSCDIFNFGNECHRLMFFTSAYTVQYDARCLMFDAVYRLRNLIAPKPINFFCPFLILKTELIFKMTLN